MKSLVFFPLLITKSGFSWAICKICSRVSPVLLDETTNCAPTKLTLPRYVASRASAIRSRPPEMANQDSASMVMLASPGGSCRSPIFC